MTAPIRPLHSLDAWPGESQQPPLRLLQTPPARSGSSLGMAHRARPLSWLQRLRQALAER
jgi:hypothetical protein